MITESQMYFGQDGDGVTAAGGGCNDSDDTIYPGTKEVIGDGINQYCIGDIFD